MAKSWVPTQRQSDFLSLPDNIFEGLFGGAAGGGKTETLLMLPVSKRAKDGKALYEHPRFKALFLRRTFPELDNEVIPRSRDFYPHFGFNSYQDQKKRWTHPSGAIIQFGHCEHETDVAKYDTSEYNMILWDEATSFTPHQYEYVSFSRCRTSSKELPAYIRAGTNPGNVGHTYFRDRFVAPAKEGNVVLRETRKVNGVPQTLLRIFIPSKVSDNPYLLAANPDYINVLNRLPEADRAAKADGDWWAFSGQVFDEFRKEPRVNEPDHARHVIEPFQIPGFWPRLIAIDWGFSAMTVCGWYAINPLPSKKYPAKIYKYREYTAKKTKISTWASDIRRLSGDEEYVDVVMDPSGWQDRGDPISIAEQFAREFGSSPRKAQNNRIAGKLLIQEMLRWSPRPPRYVPQESFDQELALKINRLYGPAKYKEYCDLFKPDVEEEFLPKFQIFNTCEKTIETLPVCVYSKTNPEDVAEFDGDDPYDETRYGLAACQNFLDNGVIEAEQTDKIAKVCSEFEQTKDINKFYRQMDRIDAVTNRAPMGFKRFHGNPRRKYANF